MSASKDGWGPDSLNPTSVPVPSAKSIVYSKVTFPRSFRTLLPDESVMVNGWPGMWNVNAYS